MECWVRVRRLYFFGKPSAYRVSIREVALLSVLHYSSTPTVTAAPINEPPEDNQSRVVWARSLRLIGFISHPWWHVKLGAGL